MITATETRTQEYHRLLSERAEITAAARAARTMTDGQRKQVRELSARLRQIVAVPPKGYALPKAAADLVALAQEHGWAHVVQWTPPGYEGEPFVNVQVGRRISTEPGTDGPLWQYQATWHSRDCAPGWLRLFGRLLAQTPDNPAWHDAASLKAVRQVIAAHPVQGGG